MTFIRITKRDDMPKKKEWLIRAAAILLALVFAGLVMLILGLNPFQIFGAILEGALGTTMRFQYTVTKAVPLIIASLGIVVAFKMKFWNIGAEGQITMGALAASYLALNMGDMPKPLLLLLMAVCAIIAGGLWAFIPAIFKAKFGTNETIFTLMMNYLAIKLVTYLQYGPWKDPSANGFPKIPTFSDNGTLPLLFGVNVGWIIALLCVAWVYFFINYTKKGYEITVVGESVETARYAGMNIKGIIVIAMLISGGLCGLTGMIQASGVERTLVATISGGMGFTAIITAWLAKLNAIAVLFVCFAFAVLIQGGAYIQIAIQAPEAVSDVVQGLILFFVLGSEFFLQYKVSLGKRFQKEVV